MALLFNKTIQLSFFGFCMRKMKILVMVCPRASQPAPPHYFIWVLIYSNRPRPPRIHFFR